MATCVHCGKKGVFLKVNAEGLCDECVQRQVTELRQALSPEQKDSMSIKKELLDLKRQRSELKEEITKFASELNSLYQSVQEKKQQVIQLDEQLLLQEFGLYEPVFHFAKSEKYKDRLSQIRSAQKAMIKAGTAVTGNMNWTVNGSAASGRKMVHDTQKLLLRAFNSECDDAVDRVKFNNYESALKKITASYQSISKLGALMSIAISPQYYDLKVKELQLALEYQIKKQNEKEEQKEIRARMREEAKLQKEIEEERKKAEKEQTHYLNALAKIRAQLAAASEAEKSDLLEKENEIQSHVDDIEQKLKDIDYRQANQKAGYVYVISNIGSFGENVYKIGMTRRLDPMERIDELGDASVPFNFDVHAMIFSDDAPALEAALHRAFESRKLNMVNTRREFFNVTLEEIKEVVRKNYDKTAEFIETADAEQYRISQKMKEEIQKQ